MPICNAYSVLLCWEYALCVKVEDVFRSGIGKPGRDRISFRSGNRKSSRFEVRFYPRNGKPGGDRAAFCSGNEFLGGDGIHSASGMAVCGAYAIRPYADDKNLVHFLVHSTTGVAACGAYAIRPYTGDLKNGDFSIHSTTAVAICGAYSIRPYTGDLKKWRFFYPFDHRCGRLWGVCNTPLHGRPKKWRFFYPFDHCRGHLWGVFNTSLYGRPEKMAFFLSVRPPVWPPVGRMQYAPTRKDENRAGFWFVFRGAAEKGAGCGLCEKWGRRASIIIRRLLPLRARRRMGPIIASAHAFIIPNYVA